MTRREEVEKEEILEMMKKEEEKEKKKKAEGQRLAADITLMYPESQLDVSRAVYQEVYDTVQEIQKEHKAKEDPTRFSYRFHVVAVPYHEDFIRKHAKSLKCEFIGFINSSLSPVSDQGSLFDGYYSWTKKGKDYFSYAHDITGVLSEYGFVFGSDRKSKSKVPCIIAANLESEKFHYQNTAKQSRIDTTYFRDGIIKAVERVAKKVHTFQSIGIKFTTEENKDYEVSNVSRGVKTTIKDIVEMMLLPRIKKVKEGGTWDEEQTQDSLWYNALPLFEDYGVKYSNDSRAHFKNCIRRLCKDTDVAREQIGIIAAPWGSMFFKGQWFDISFDTIEDLAEKGTDIVFIEKRDIVRALGRYATKKGVALVNTHGLLSDYTEDLAELANKVGAHIALLTDYDIPGLLIASKLSDENVPRLGVDERMLRAFDISHENTDLVIPYTAKKARLSSYKLREMINNDSRFNSDDIDIDFLKYHKIEIDAILSKVGAEELWQYLQDLLEEEFPNRDYRRVINPKPDLSKHYPAIVKQLQLYCDNYAREITKAESEKIEKELKEVEGFIDVEKKEKKILDDRLGKIVKEDKHLAEVAEAFVAAAREKGYNKILEIEILPNEEQEEEEEGEGVPKSEAVVEAKYPDISSDIPDPPITQKHKVLYHDICGDLIEAGRAKDCFWQPVNIAKNLIVQEHGPKELDQKLAKFWDTNCRWGFGHDKYGKMLQEAYEQTIRQYKEQHNNRLPWQQEDKEVIPDLPITEKDIEYSKRFKNWTPLDCAKIRVITLHGSAEINEKMENGTIDSRGEMYEAYKEVVRQYKEQHNQRLPWHDEEKQKVKEDQ